MIYNKDYGQCTNGDVQLVNGAIYQEGRVEICVNGVWGSICNDDWSTTDSAFVVCKQLGFINSGIHIIHTIYHYA